jgi:hypothetical protein
MTKDCIFIALMFIACSVFAKNTCDNVHWEQSYPPLNVKGGAICFVREPVFDSKENLPIGADAISLYYLVDGGVPVKAEGRGLLYDDTPGQIVDAFSLNVGRDHVKKIFVIHYVEVRASIVEPNSSGKFYSINVFDLDGEVLRRDECASDWFGVGYSFLSNGSMVNYRYPYLARVDVERAMDSPLSSLMNCGGEIPVKIKYKSYLFDGPVYSNKTKKYLIKGDLAMVERITAGWCQINYFGGGRAIKMWLACGALEVGAQAKNVD